jgi:prophage tail gpP-like protein
MPTVDQIRSEKQLESDADRIAIYIAGEKIPLPSTFVYNEYFDACSDSFELGGYPKEAIDKVLDLQPGGLDPIAISIAGENVLNGKIEILAPSITADGTLLSFSGRNQTYILSKSSLPRGIQREFKNLSLKNIATIVCNAFKLDVEIESNVNFNFKFKRATCKDSDSAYAFLSRLCKEVGAVLTNTYDGRPLIRKSTFGNPVANFDLNREFIKFLGIQGISSTYDTTKLHGEYVGKTQTPRSSKNVSVAKSQVIDEISVKYLSFDDSTSGSLPNMVKTAEKKVLREFFATSIPYPSWINPETGKRWKTGDTVVVDAVNAYIEEKELLINQIAFKSDESAEVAELFLKSVEAYS